VAALACISTLSACGSGAGDDGTDAAKSAAAGESGLVAWPLFGRVPERTHYLPAPNQVLDPPLRQAWSINTHALIEFPPALAGGVAYVVNKYGNAKAVRLSDHKVLWEKVTDPSDHGKPTDVTAPVYHQGKVFFAYLNGDLAAVDAATGKQVWARNMHSHLESSPMAVGGKLYIGSDKTNVIALQASDGKVLWQYNSRRDQSQPELPPGPRLRRRLRGGDVLPRCRLRPADLAHQHDAGAAVRRGRLLLLPGDRLRPRLRRP
jgi:outer membrane protein assembly factor BamB